VWSAYVLAAAVVADLAYIASLWPDWEQLAKGPIPKTSFMRRYETQRRLEGGAAQLEWIPIAYSQIAPTMRRAAVVAEDSRFYHHNGVDTQAIQEAIDYNLKVGRIRLGASTISQQTAKNLFLSASRDPLRKWHELLLTLAMEHHLSKRRILEIYLNVAEFGSGIYGVEAAARHYWGIPARRLSPAQAMQLAASLPNPRVDNPDTRTAAFKRRYAKIHRHMAAYAGGG
jgi:monofunctional biosynthetic peptidoglycan transglycosylase